MPRRNQQISSNQVYWVQKPNGKHYKVWSKEVLDARIERGEITPEHTVKIQRTYV